MEYAHWHNQITPSQHRFDPFTQSKLAGVIGKARLNTHLAFHSKLPFCPSALPPRKLNT